MNDHDSLFPDPMKFSNHARFDQSQPQETSQVTPEASDELSSPFAAQWNELELATWDDELGDFPDEIDQPSNEVQLDPLVEQLRLLSEARTILLELQLDKDNPWNIGNGLQARTLDNTSKSQMGYDDMGLFEGDSA